jgi:hypothetical protein
MHCTNCGTQNQTGYQFCMKCGARLNLTTSPEPAENIIQNRPSEPDQPILPVYPSPKPITQPQIQNRAAQPYPRPEGMPLLPGRSTPAAAISLIGIWRPFAGYGTRRRHTGWLMDNQEGRAQDLANKVTQKLNERTIPGAQVERRSLVGRGVIVETRPYFLVKRGLVTVGLYITQFGKDLFVSLASYLKPPLSNFRLLVLVLMTFFAAYTLFIFPDDLASAVENLFGGISIFGGGRTDSSSNLGSLLCIVGPLGTVNLLALLLFVIFSIYKFVTEKDILAGLRVTPNEFNEDDLMAIEKAVEQTVRMSLDEIGLNADDLKPIAVEDNRRLI